MDAPEKPDPPRRESQRSIGPALAQVAILMVLIVAALMLFSFPDNSAIKYSFFLEQLDAKNVSSVVLTGNLVTGTFRTPPELPAESAAKKAAERDTEKAEEKAAEKKDAKPIKLKEKFT